MKVLEIGNYIAPAYAGMILSEQGHDVTKVWTDRDPTLTLDRGDELWSWINYGKNMISDVHVRDIESFIATYRFDVVIDNFRSETIAQYEIDPSAIAKRHSLAWVSLRDDLDERSFDVVAQARSWMEYASYVPFYAGDTCAGLWVAFKALSMNANAEHDHAIIYQATAMQKLVEGELVIDVERDRVVVPWDKEMYRGDSDGAEVEYRDVVYREPVRDREWKLEHLHHDNGRMRI